MRPGQMSAIGPVLVPDSREPETARYVPMSGGGRGCRAPGQVSCATRTLKQTHPPPQPYGEEQRRRGLLNAARSLARTGEKASTERHPPGAPGSVALHRRAPRALPHLDLLSRAAGGPTTSPGRVRPRTPGTHTPGVHRAFCPPAHAPRARSAPNACLAARVSTPWPRPAGRCVAGGS